jgi:aspartyl-tRNA(Asn)/glutamyl-tRNA(Gln) amidotransferase subunit A
VRDTQERLEVPEDYTTFRKSLLQGEASCVEVTQRYVERIQKDKSHAFLTLFDEQVLKQAEAVDKKIKDGTAGRLAGLVIALKDNLCLRGSRTTCASKVLENFIAPFDATAVHRLKREDAIIIGKTNMDEFGMGSSCENSAFGPVKNPFNPDRVPGGSSGGSAAAVAARLCMTALGTDTGGSVRQPASHCGIIGLRPTYGRISRYGLVAFASSLDQIGILSLSIQDCALLLNILSGFDPRDSTSSTEAVNDFTNLQGDGITGLRVGLPVEYFQDGLQPEIKRQILETVEAMAKAGATIHEVSLSKTDYGIATYYLICTAEASSNLARYDGIRYGYRNKDGDSLRSLYEQSRHIGLGKEVKRRIMLGTYVLSAGYYDAYYLKAQKVRTLIRQDFDKAFRNCDVIVGPVSPTTAFRFSEKIDPLEMYLSDLYTVSAPLAGLPAISVPIGFDLNRLPIGMQLTAPEFHETLLLKTGDWIQAHRPSSVQVAGVNERRRNGI